MSVELIKGTRHTDSRGMLDFFNSFDLTEIVRFYRICPSDINNIRAWQGHMQEQKWFYCLKGSFVVNLIPLSKFNKETSSVIPEIFTLHAHNLEILKVPGGYVNGFRALEPNSELLVFSDNELEASKKDDVRFSLEERPFVEVK